MTNKEKREILREETFSKAFKRGKDYLRESILMIDCSMSDYPFSLWRRSLAKKNLNYDYGSNLHLYLKKTMFYKDPEKDFVKWFNQYNSVFRVKVENGFFNFYYTLGYLAYSIQRGLSSLKQKKLYMTKQEKAFQNYLKLQEKYPDLMAEVWVYNNMALEYNLPRDKDLERRYKEAVKDIKKTLQLK